MNPNKSSNPNSGTSSEETNRRRRRFRELCLYGEDEIGRIMRRAVREELLRHKKLGNSIVEWRDGKVIHVPPEEITFSDEPE